MSELEVPPTTPPHPQSISLLTLVLMFAVAGIGMSHVQTTYQLQKLEKDFAQLQSQHQKFSELGVSQKLVDVLSANNIVRVADLESDSMTVLLHEESLDDVTKSELDSMLDKLGIQRN